MVIRSAPPMDFDCLVVGHGAAGLLCASRLASRNVRVAVVGTGETSTSLSTGCISVLDQIEGDLIDPNVLASQFPYSLAGKDRDEVIMALEDLYSFLIPDLEIQGLPMRGNPLSIRRMLTSLGTPYQCSIPQMYNLGGRLEHISEKGTSLLGIMGHRDSDPDLASRMIKSTLDMEIRSFWTKPSSLEGRTDLTACEVSRLAKRKDLTDDLAEAISEVEGELVGIPPVFDLSGYQEGMSFLERSSGKKVFELVTPLSLPGRRLQAAMESMARAKGCTMLLGWRALDVEIINGKVTGVVLNSRSREARVDLSSIVLATGDSVGGGLTLKDQSMFEPLMGASCTLMREDLRTLHAEDLVGLSNAGVEVDSVLRPRCSGEIISNAAVAGSVISGFSYPSGGGMGAAMLTAWLAAQTIMEVVG
jgi:anaerobic glycerol-3-phosphate dehydrogenase B subunit